MCEVNDMHAGLLSIYITREFSQHRWYCIAVLTHTNICDDFDRFVWSCMIFIIFSVYLCMRRTLPVHIFMSWGLVPLPFHVKVLVSNNTLSRKRNTKGLWVAYVYLCCKQYFKTTHINHCIFQFLLHTCLCALLSFFIIDSKNFSHRKCVNK